MAVKGTRDIIKKRNFFAICNATTEFYEEKRRFPTYKELSELTKLSVRCIQEHKKEWDKLPLGQKVEDYKAFIPQLMDNILENSKINASSQKLALQIIENWSEKTEMEHSGKISCGYDFDSMSKEEIQAFLDKHSDGNSKNS